MIAIDESKDDEGRAPGGSRVMRAVRSCWLAAVVALAAACGSDSATAPVTTDVTDPARAEFITSDIPNFWTAYDASASSGAITPFQTEYLDRASPGLADFTRSRSLTAANLAGMVQAFPRYFADIRTSTLRLANDGAVQARM